MLKLEVQGPILPGTGMIRSLRKTAQRTRAILSEADLIRVFNNTITVQGRNVTLADPAQNIFARIETVISTQRVYWEYQSLSHVSARIFMGIADPGFNLSSTPGAAGAQRYALHYTSSGIGRLHHTGNIFADYGTPHSSGQTISVLYDGSTRELWFYRNGVSLGRARVMEAGTYYPVLGGGGNTSARIALKRSDMAFSVPAAALTPWEIVA